MFQKSPLEEEDSYEKNLMPDDIVRDEEAHYESEEEIEARLKDKPVGPPMELEIPLRPPPAQPDKVLFLFLCSMEGHSELLVDTKALDVMVQIFYMFVDFSVLIGWYH